MPASAGPPGVVRIGCAGWSLPRDGRDAFPAGPSHLARMALALGCTEINSSFHRPHRRETYARWAASVPAGFAFSAKVPRTITHDRRLADHAALLDDFLAQVAGLGGALQVLLVQLPPSLAFDAGVAGDFFQRLAERHPAAVAVEPRHASWFTPAVDAWMAQRRLARVLADPVRHRGGEAPGGWPGLAYLRLHGTPRIYHSPYGDDVLQALAARIVLASRAGQPVWCIFDNIASQAAAADALRLQSLLRQT